MIFLCIPSLWRSSLWNDVWMRNMQVKNRQKLYLYKYETTKKIYKIYQLLCISCCCFHSYKQSTFRSEHLSIPCNKF